MHFFILLITLGDISMIIVFIGNQYLVFIIKFNNIHKTLLGTADMHRDFLHK